MSKLNRLTMTLALLIMAVGGAWADYTVTWEGTTLQGIAVKNNTATTSQTVEGITVTASNGEFFYNTNFPIKPVVIASSSANNGLVFSAENNIKSIAITFTESANYGSSMAFEAGAYTYQVSPAAKSFALPKNDSFIGITKVVFTLEGDAPVAGPEVIELKPDDTGKKWILADMPASDIELQVEYEPTKVTMAANDNTMGTVEVGGESKVEWTADTWQGWTSSTKEYTVDDITMTSTNSAYINEYTYEGVYLHSLSFFVNQTDDNSTVTFSTTGDPFSRIEFTMIDDYAEDEYFNYKWHGNPTIMPKDNWTFEGKSAVWEGEATKSLTLQSCSTQVSKITFYKGAIPDGVTVNGDGTFTVAKTATVTLTATPAEGYKFLYWEDDQTNTNPVREVTIESGMADMTYTAVFEEITYNVTFVEGTDLNEWTATPNTEVKKDTKVDIKYTGTKKVIGVKVEKKGEAKTLAEATSEDIGKIVGADGKIYATKADAEAVATGNAVAVIAYVGSETGDDTYKNGLAIALADESNSDWSTAKSTCEGKTPTVTGAKWCLPSQDQWKQMFKANGGNEGSYTGLNATITTAGGTALKEYGDYWSSSEEDPGAGAWDVYLANGSADWFVSNEESAYQVRACLAF